MIGLRGLPATWGGVERHVEELGSRLVARGHEVTAFCRTGYTDAAISSHRGIAVKVLRTPHGRGIEALTHSFASAARTLTEDYDVVHFHAIGPGLAAVLPRYLSRVRVVQTIHGLDADRAKWSLAERLVLQVAMRFSTCVPHATVTVSRDLQAHYLQRFRRATTYIPNGCAVPSHGDADRLRDRFGLEPQSYVLSVGRLVPEKAPDVLLEAFRQVPGDLRLVLAGGSSDTDAYADHLRRLASLDERVLMPGYVFGEDLAALYSHARAFVLPSLLEGMPLTLLEAMSYSLPVVVSSIPPHLEVLGGDGPGARVALAGDSADLRAALLRVLQDEDEERLGAHERSRQVLGEYDWDHATDLLEQVYLQHTEVLHLPTQRSHQSRRPLEAADVIDLVSPAPASSDIEQHPPSVSLTAGPGAR